MSKVDFQKIVDKAADQLIQDIDNKYIIIAQVDYNELKYTDGPKKGQNIESWKSWVRYNTSKALFAVISELQSEK